MITQKLKFCFKGSRDYVQGPDIFDNVIKKVSLIFDLTCITNIKYSAYSMLHRNANMYLLEEFERDEFETINSLITFDYNQKKYYVVVVENNHSISCSNDYSENIVRNNSVIENNEIIFANSLPDSLTEIIVSMNKYFLQSTVSTNGKWIVTKFDYSKIHQQYEIAEKNIMLKLISNFNNKLTKSAILIDGEQVGFLYFSLV